MKSLSLILALGLAGAPALAADVTAGALLIENPMAFETPRGAMAGGGYMTITNTGDSADRLLAVRADYPKVSLHLSQETDGVATMTPVEMVEIPAGQSVHFAPGGLHVMFMGLRGTPFVAGDSVPATLVFDHAGEVAVAFDVMPRDGDMPMGHGQGHGQGHGGTDMTN